MSALDPTRTTEGLTLLRDRPSSSGALSNILQPEHITKLYRRYCLHGAAAVTRYRVGSLESGTLLCQAYECYLELHAPVSISFEHAWFLLLALARRDEVGMAR